MGGAKNLWVTTKAGLDNVGVGYPLRQAYVNARSLGEHALHLVDGRPSPESTILVAGAGRSGTTWLGELISHGARIQEIFEPLTPFWNKKVCELAGWGTEGHFLQATYLREDEMQPMWRSHLHDIFTGRIRNYWTDARRTSWFPNRYLVKEIRMNLMLGFIARQLGPKIVFILRNPIHVIASRLALGWRIDLGQLLSQEMLLTDHLEPWADELRSVTDDVERHAAWWAVENLVALRELSDWKHDVIVYEELVEEPVMVANALRKKLGLGAEIDAEAATKPSRIAEGCTRINRRASLSEGDLRKIRHWCRRFELTRLLPPGAGRWH